MRDGSWNALRDRSVIFDLCSKEFQELRLEVGRLKEWAGPPPNSGQLMASLLNLPSLPVLIDLYTNMFFLNAVND